MAVLQTRLLRAPFLRILSNACQVPDVTLLKHIIRILDAAVTLYSHPPLGRTERTAIMSALLRITWHLRGFIVGEDDDGNKEDGDKDNEEKDKVGEDNDIGNTVLPTRKSISSLSSSVEDEPPWTTLTIDDVNALGTEITQSDGLVKFISETLLLGVGEIIPQNRTPSSSSLPTSTDIPPDPTLEALKILKRLFL